MKITIDSAGRLVIPREIRRQAGIQPGMALDVRWQDGRIEIEPAVLSVRVERQGHLLVAVTEDEGATLSTEAVEAMRERLQVERGVSG